MRKKLLISTAAVLVIAGGSALAYRAISRSPQQVSCGIGEYRDHSPFSNEVVCRLFIRPNPEAQAAWAKAGVEAKTENSQLLGPDVPLSFQADGVAGDPTGQTDVEFLAFTICNTGSKTATDFAPERLLLSVNDNHDSFGFDYVLGSMYQPTVDAQHHEIWPIYPTKCLRLRVAPLWDTHKVWLVYTDARGVPLTNQALVLSY